MIWMQTFIFFHCNYVNTELLIELLFVVLQPQGDCLAFLAGSAP